MSEVLGGKSEARLSATLRLVVYAVIALVLGAAAVGTWTSWRSVTAAAPSVIASLEPPAVVESVGIAGPDSFLVRFVAADGPVRRGSVYVRAPWFDDELVYTSPVYGR